jgi:hypothetical protein
MEIRIAIRTDQVIIHLEASKQSFQHYFFTSFYKINIIRIREQSKSHVQLSFDLYIRELSGQPSYSLFFVRYLRKEKMRGLSLHRRLRISIHIKYWFCLHIINSIHLNFWWPWCISRNCTNFIGFLIGLLLKRLRAFVEARYCKVKLRIPCLNDFISRVVSAYIRHCKPLFIH